MAEENPKQKPKVMSKEQLLAINRTKQKDESQKARKKVIDTIDDKDADISPSTRFAQGAIRDILQDPIEEAEAQWATARRAFREKELRDRTEGIENISLGEYVTELGDVTLPFEEKMKQAALIAVAYLEEMTEGGKITAAVIERMKKSLVVNVIAFRDVLLRKDKDNEKLLAAIAWSLGMSSAKGKSVDAGKEAALETLTKHLDADTKTFAWMILTFMDSNDRVAFAKDYINSKPRSFADTTKFVEAENANGVFSPEEMKAIIGAGFNEEKREKYALCWKHQNDLVEAAKYMTESSQGGKDVGEMITLKNILFHAIGPLWAVLTIGGNAFLPFISGEGWKTPFKTGKDVIANHNNLIATGYLVIENLSKKGKSVVDFFAGDEEENKRKARTDLHTGTASNPGWRDFFVENDYSGAGVFWEYIQDSRRGDNKDKLDPYQLKLAGFVKWLDHKAEKDSKKAKYIKLREKFEGSEEEGYEIAGIKTKDSDLARLANAFHVLKIGGVQTKSVYTAAINAAKGGTPTKTA